MQERKQHAVWFFSGFLLFLSKNKNMYVLAVATFIMGTASLVLPFGDSRTFIFYLAALAISIGSVDAGKKKQRRKTLSLYL